MLNYETLLAANLLITGSQLRDLFSDLSPEQFTQWVNQKLDASIPNTCFVATDVAEVLTKQLGMFGIYDNERAVAYFTNQFVKDESNCASQYATNVMRDDFEARLSEFLHDEYSKQIQFIEAMPNLTHEKCVSLLSSIGITDNDDDIEDIREAIESNFYDGTLKISK